MSLLIIPYDGESAQLTAALKRYKVSPPNTECKGGSCPIPKPLRMMTESEVKTVITNTIKSVGNVKHISVLALNEKDQFSLVDMSRKGDWGSLKSGVTVKIIHA